MKNVPASLDGAAVLLVAELVETQPTGSTRHVVRTAEVSGFSYLAIAKYENDSDFYLFYCDDEWTVVTDTCHSTIDSAVAQAKFEFEHVEFTEPPATSLSP